MSMRCQPEWAIKLIDSHSEVDIMGLHRPHGISSDPAPPKAVRTIELHWRLGKSQPVGPPASQRASSQPALPVLGNCEVVCGDHIPPSSTTAVKPIAGDMAGHTKHCSCPEACGQWRKRERGEERGRKREKEVEKGIRAIGWLRYAQPAKYPWATGQSGWSHWWHANSQNAIRPGCMAR